MQEVAGDTKERADLGVYFLANNREIHWVLAFLASFRKSNPTLPLTLIPYNDNYDLIASLADRYDFNLLASETYAELDAINAMAWPNSGNHMFRKFAAFSGVYDRFFYLDSDILVTADLRPLAAAAEKSDFDLVFFDTNAEHIDHVYKPGALRQKMLTEYQTKAFNAGAWWSRRGTFTVEEVAARVRETADVRSQFVHSGDQPYLNYCCDLGRKKTEQFSNLLPNLMPSSMTTDVKATRKGIRWLQAKGEWAGREVCLIHYASFGIPQAAMPNYGFYLSNRAKAEGAFKTQIWNLRWQGQRIKHQTLNHFKPKADLKPQAG